MQLPRAPRCRWSTKCMAISATSPTPQQRRSAAACYTAQSRCFSTSEYSGEFSHFQFHSPPTKTKLSRCTFRKRQLTCLSSRSVQVPRSRSSYRRALHASSFLAAYIRQIHPLINSVYFYSTKTKQHYPS